MVRVKDELLSGAAPLSIQNKGDGTRRVVHLAFGACALLVPVLGRWPSVALAAVACAYNGVVAPRLRLDRVYRREGEGRFSGLVTYPLAVLCLLLVCPLPVAAAAWGVLAVADPIAAAVGSRFPVPRLPGNPRKSIVGSLAGFASGSLACAVLLAYMDVADPVAPALAATAAGVLAEALPLRLDDNLPIAAATAAVLMAWGL